MVKIIEGMTRREWLVFELLEKGAHSLYANECVSSTALDHPEWDMDEIKSLDEWRGKEMVEQPKAQNKRNKYRGLAAKVENYFLSNADRSITISELRREFVGVPDGPIKSAITYCRTRKNRQNMDGRGSVRPNMNIETEVQGTRWRYISGKPAMVPVVLDDHDAKGQYIGPPIDATKGLFETLATTRNGTVLVEGEDGEIYKLTKI